MLRAVTAAAALLFTACSAPRPAPGSVDHLVLVWQKRPGHPDDRRALLAACDELRQLPGVRSLHAGTALASPRPVVDDSFDLGILMRFDSAAALRAYEQDPRHLAKVNEVLLPLTRKRLVYDIRH